MLAESRINYQAQAREPMPGYSEMTLERLTALRVTKSRFARSVCTTDILTSQPIVSSTLGTLPRKSYPNLLITLQTEDNISSIFQLPNYLSQFRPCWMKNSSDFFTVGCVQNESHLYFLYFRWQLLYCMKKNVPSKILCN